MTLQPSTPASPPRDVTREATRAAATEPGTALRAWCSGPMIAVFDAALDGEPRAIAAAQSVCQQCPMLELCRSDAQAKPARRRWGVQGGIYTPAKLPAELRPLGPSRARHATSVA